MKFIITLCVFIAAAVTTHLHAQTFSAEGLEFTVVSETEKTVSINRFLDDFKGGWTYTLPEKVAYQDAEYTVTEIGRLAFYKCRNITLLTIPNTITTIGYSAFERLF